MSDPAKPGAPTGPKSIPPASEKSVSHEVQKRAPKAVGLLATPDRILLRLNKLVAAPGGLAALLSTFNYTLYILTHLEQKAIPLKIYLTYRLFPDAEISFPAPGSSNIAALGAMISQTRTVIRLFGLLPLYAWARQLMQGPKPGADSILYTNSVTQCGLYIAFQFLENVAFLTDGKVLPTSWTARWTAKSGGTTAEMYQWSYRFWMLAVLCDFVRLGREAQLERAKRSKRSDAEIKDVDNQDADKEVDAKWWSEVVSPLAWFPIAWQYGGTGVPGFHLGWMGVAGGIAGLQRTTALWKATADSA